MEQQTPPNNNPKKSNEGFNAYWIYGIILLIIIGVNLFYMVSPGKGDISSIRFEEMANKGDIEKIEIVNMKQAYVYLSKDALNKDEYKDKLTSSLGVRPNYYFNIGPPEKFSEKIFFRPKVKVLLILIKNNFQCLLRYAKNMKSRAEQSFLTG